MNRREFLSCLNPLRVLREGNEASSTTSTDDRASQNKLFVQAMAKGIDPATVDPDRLASLLQQETNQP